MGGSLQIDSQSRVRYTQKYRNKPVSGNQIVCLPVDYTFQTVKSDNSSVKSMFPFFLFPGTWNPTKN